MSAETHPSEPVITVTGGATAAEVAAIVTALAALGADDSVGTDHDARGRGGRSLWNSRARAARPRLSPGPGAWRGSALPR